MEDFKSVKFVEIIDSENGELNGLRARVIDVEEHKFGIDLRIVVEKTGEKMWISSESVYQLEESLV
ncbi:MULTISPECIES: hypothetical protein [Aneurinibacillus]|uniref:Uncharacterized protein n=1 Tax=Aneurinibacillus thermoaerophilus TaxID=143495 RepID=A0ABX8Y7N5_ANETH|nr:MULTISPECIES: hypothetical protein [Aneurinibacillus]AMA72757.1 hypothetical protein ACH33_07755 [Aneurinibacillus sp. XH2]MED0737817.1 hypothetical protein [Aneurinibacillus thermoaerophilus]QYY41482.1 hypothetical protein K3F53_11075 [Aneurinibacillus thermoaerophilus]